MQREITKILTQLFELITSALPETLLQIITVSLTNN